MWAFYRASKSLVKAGVCPLLAAVAGRAPSFALTGYTAPMSESSTTRWSSLNLRWIVVIALAMLWLPLNWYFNTIWWNDFVTFELKVIDKLAKDFW